MFRAMRSEELPAGEGTGTRIRRVRTDAGHVMVARLADGGLVAFAPSCPHQVTPLDEATIRDGVLRCPRHGYQYDATTGANVYPAREAAAENLWKLRPGYLPVHAVTERDGWIWVDEQPGGPPESWDPALEQRPAGTAEGAGEAAGAPAAAGSLAAAPGAPAASLTVATPSAVEQSVQFLTAPANEIIEIRVPTTVVDGFQWRLALVGDALAVVDDAPEPGEMPCHRVRLAAGPSGAGTLTCTYASASGQVAAMRTYVIRIV